MAARLPYLERSQVPADILMVYDVTRLERPTSSCVGSPT